MTQPTAPAGATPRERFRAAFEREHATTRKVLHAYPAEQSELKPHERSSSARQLAWTFIVEEGLMLKALRHEQLFGGGRPPMPETWADLLAGFDRMHDEVTAALREAGEALDGTVGFFVAPKQMGEYALEERVRAMDDAAWSRKGTLRSKGKVMMEPPVGEFLWFLLFDAIHHRGQLSAYIRPMGGKVPSIYGPSADEPWN